MQSPGPPCPPYRGPPVVSPDLYVNRNYENHIQGVSQSVSNSYLTYHSSAEESHSSSNPSNYCEQSHYSTGSPTTHSTHVTPSTHLQYNSSNSGPTYGQPVNQFNEMYSTCSPFAANIPQAIRQPIPSSVKYWNSVQRMSHNSHNSYNQGIPPPPLVSRTPGLGSPTHRSFSASQQRSSSQSPQDWNRSPNVMHSPSTTPSPLPSHGRSPSQQFSPSHDSSHPTVQKAQTAQTAIEYSNQNSSQGVNASNPLQSLQKMVMIESDSTDIRTGYDNIGTTSLQNNGSAPMTANSTHKNYNSDQNLNIDPESPYPTYYNMDQNRLCTPPRPSPNSNSSYNNIPDERTDGFATSGQLLCESDTELKKCETNDNNSNNDLIFGLESKAETIRQIKAKVSLNSKISMNGSENTIKTDGNVVNNENSSEVSLEKCSKQTTVPAICKRTASRDSIQSSDSETAHSAQHNWQLESDYYNSQHNSDIKNTWPQWPHNSLPKSPAHSVPQNNYLPDGRPVVPNPSNPYQSSHRPTQCGTNSWGPSASSSSSTPNQDFAAPNLMNQTTPKKKRGRPFGSKNRRNSEDTNSETNTSEVSSLSKKKKKSTEEIGVNTSVTIDAHGFDELTVVNPLKHNSKRKKTVGPFIRLEKRRAGKATVFSIVNTSTKPEDEKDIKTKSLSTKLDSIKPIRRPSLMASTKKVVSTLSPHYDLNTRDKTWVCALCHRGPHYKGLGDLYGPYYIPEDKNKNQLSAQSSTQTVNPSVVTTATATTSRSNSIDEVIDSVVANEKKGRRRKSETPEEPTKGRPKQITKTLNSTQTSETETTHSSNTLSEAWVHEDCIVWSSGVYLVGHRVRNLEEVISESQENLCSKCKLSGATLGCLQKSCNNSQFHYLCAKEKGCDLNDDNFSVVCPKHKKKTKTSSDEPSVCSFTKT